MTDHTVSLGRTTIGCAVSGYVPVGFASSVARTVTYFGCRPNSISTDGTGYGTAGIGFVAGSRMKGGAFGACPDPSNLDEDGNVFP